MLAFDKKYRIFMLEKNYFVIFMQLFISNWLSV